MNSHGQVAVKPGTVVPFPSSDAPFSVIPPCRRPPEIEKKVKQRKNRSTEETDLKKGKTESRSEKERNGLKSIACIVFLVAGHGESHRRQESEEEKKLSQIHLFTGSGYGGVWKRRAASGGACGTDALPLFCDPEAFPVVPWSFKGYYVILFV